MRLNLGLDKSLALATARRRLASRVVGFGALHFARRQTVTSCGCTSSVFRITSFQMYTILFSFVYSNNYIFFVVVVVNLLRWVVV
jgi:hypothetical protein